jgi:hypothetical protein
MVDGAMAAQVEQGKPEGRVHEARLNIGANEHAEPNQIDAQLVGHRRQQRDDGRFEQIFGQTAALQDCAHEGEEGDRQQ